MTLPVLPKWATDPDALVLTPDSAKQIQGWTTDTNTDEGQGETQPLQYVNWLARQTYQCLSAIYEIIGNNTPPGIFSTGMRVGFEGVPDAVPVGWILAQDGTIGNSVSGASIRANTDTYALYLMYYAYSDSVCPVIGGRSGNATTDFDAGKPITIFRYDGMVQGCSGSGNASTQGGVITSARSAGSIFGEENHTLTIPEMPAHSHSYQETTGRSPADGSSPGFSVNSTANTGITGGDGAHNTIQPTTWLPFIIKL